MKKCGKEEQIDIRFLHFYDYIFLCFNLVTFLSLIRVIICFESLTSYIYRETEFWGPFTCYVSQILLDLNSPPLSSTN